jgi:hypothetical protein
MQFNAFVETISMATISIGRKKAGGLHVGSAARNVVCYLINEWRSRRDRQLLALVAVPLAMNASGLETLWWTWVPLLLCAAACTPAWRWVWCVTLPLAAIGTQWAFVGETALITWPGSRLIVGAVWAGFALGLAIAAKANRRYWDLPERHIHW